MFLHIPTAAERQAKEWRGREALESGQELMNRKRPLLVATSWAALAPH
jgi:hypothetical protein